MAGTKSAAIEAAPAGKAKATNTTKATKVATPAKPPKSASAQAAKPGKATASAKAAKSTKSVKPLKTAKAKKGGKTAKAKKTAAAPKASYRAWVIEAVQALQADDKLFISLKRIKDYIYTHIDQATPARISRYAKSAVESLVDSKIFKQKKDSVAFGAKAGDIATAEAPARPVVREKAALVTVDAGDNLTPGLLHTTQSGRIALRRY
jgi:hypothetical protein